MNNIKPNKLQKDIAVICDYLEVDEKRHYEESGRPKDHIWLHVKRIQKYLKYLRPFLSKSMVNNEF